jgi:hypothetical protein
MKIKCNYIVFVFLVGTQFFYGQFFKDNVYYEGEVGAISSLFVKEPDGNTKVFTVGGLSFRGGVGINNSEKSLFIGINSGVEGNFRWKLGILPVYLNGKVAFEVGDNQHILLSVGYGKSFQVGPENLKGNFRKISIAYGKTNKRENFDNLFIELNNHGFYFSEGIPGITINFGVNFMFF